MDVSHLYDNVNAPNLDYTYAGDGSLVGTQAILDAQYNDMPKIPQTKGLRTRWHEDITMVNANDTIQWSNPVNEISININEAINKIQELEDRHNELLIRFNKLESLIRNEGGPAQTLGLRTRLEPIEEDLFADL